MGVTGDVVFAPFAEHAEVAGNGGVLAGWYHAISYAARATRLAAEPGTPSFSDVGP
jgi:hypothetical protein